MWYNKFSRTPGYMIKSITSKLVTLFIIYPGIGIISQASLQHILCWQEDTRLNCYILFSAFASHDYCQFQSCTLANLQKISALSLWPTVLGLYLLPLAPLINLLPTAPHFLISFGRRLSSDRSEARSSRQIGLLSQPAGINFWHVTGLLNWCLSFTVSSPNWVSKRILFTGFLCICISKSVNATVHINVSAL